MGFFFKRSRAANSVVCGKIGPKFELIQKYIVVLITCKNEEDPILNQSTPLVRFYSDAQGQLTPKSVAEFRRN